MIDSYHCPRCSRLLRVSGSVTVDGEAALPVFQCDECLSVVQAFGDSIEVAFTFVVRPDGSWIEPAAEPSDPSD